MPPMKKAEREGIQSLPIKSILPNPYQPRTIFEREALSSLAASIQRHGLIQPIAVRGCSYGYELISGERRLRASLLAGIENIPAVILNVDESEAALLSLTENMQREQLSCFEQARGFSRVLCAYNITQKELADRLCMDQSTISNKLRLLRLSDAVQNEILALALTERQARALLRLGDEAQQLKATALMNSRALNALQSEQLVERMRQEAEGTATSVREPRVKGVFRDFRLFANSMKSAVQNLRSSGLKAEFHMRDDKEKVFLEIVIPK